MKKKLLLAVMLLTVPAFAADSTTAPERVVREFAKNDSTQDWWLGGGWTWSDGTLTHWPGSGRAVAEQRIMPPLTPGRAYGINFALSGGTKGTVAVSLGKVSSPAYGWSGDTFPVALTVSDPDALLTFTPTSDYDGSISKIRVVELGDELVGENTWTLADGWSQEGGAFRHASGESASLTGAVAVVAGHTYRVYFGIAGASDDHPEWKGGTVSLGGTKSGWFTRAGNYSFEIVATDEGPLVIDPVDAKIGGAWFDGAISRISVREIVTDPVPTVPATAGLVTSAGN